MLPHAAIIDISRMETSGSKASCLMSAGIVMYVVQV